MLPCLTSLKNLRHPEGIAPARPRRSVRALLGLNAAARPEAKIQLARPKLRLKPGALRKAVPRPSRSARHRRLAQTGLQDVRLRPVTHHRPTAARERDLATEARGQPPATRHRSSLKLPALHPQLPRPRERRQPPQGCHPPLPALPRPPPLRLVPGPANDPPVRRSVAVILPRPPRPPLARRCLP